MFSQTTGVAALSPGREAFHTTFSDLDQDVGNPFSVVDPLKLGPRHWAQLSAWMLLDTASVSASIRQRFMNVILFNLRLDYKRKRKRMRRRLEV